MNRPLAKLTLVGRVILNQEEPEKTNNKLQITNNIQLSKTKIQKKDVSRIHKLFRPSIRKFDNVFAHLGGDVE
jgi:hypothetical protein